jgi:apolipoprotein N-acyltransferase
MLLKSKALLIYIFNNLICIALGLVTVFASTPYYFFPILFLVFPALLLLVLKSHSKRAAFSKGFWYGFGYTIGMLYWIITPFFSSSFHTPTIFTLSFLLLPIFIGLFSGLACLITWRVVINPIGKILVFSICWTLFMWFTARIAPHIPITLLGYHWEFSDAIMQLTAYMGIYGLSYFTVLFSTAPAALFLPLTGRKKIFFLFFVIILALSLYIIGLWRLANAQINFIPDTNIRIVQTANTLDDKVNKPKEILNELIGFSHKLPTKAQLIIWPEYSINDVYVQGVKPEGLNIAKDNQQDLSRFIPGGNIFINAISSQIPKQSVIITGLDSVNLKTNVLLTQKQYRFKTDVQQLYNSLIAIDEHKQVLAIYHKQHRMPFAEYNPLNGLLKIPKLLDLLHDYYGAMSIDYSAGTKRSVIKIGKLPGFVPLICYESIFSGEVINRNEPRPGWILIITNDNWLAGSVALDQHFSATKIRAIEEGLPLVISSNGGISTIIDPYGRILQQLKPGTEGIIDTLLPTSLSPTLYARYGNYILVILLIISLGIVWLVKDKD